MSRPPRGLSADEVLLWRKVTDTVTPLHPVQPDPTVRTTTAAAAPDQPDAVAEPAQRRVKGRVPLPRVVPTPPTPSSRPLTSHGLDSTWDRKLMKGAIDPDLTIDLHGLTLDAAHARLHDSITQALALGARVILLITGKSRPHDEHDSRGQRRGAIRAKMLDWLAHSPHASRIAAVRPAQQRHGGAGAVYIVLRRAK